MNICQSPLDVAQGFAQAWNSYDAEALAALFVEDADFVKSSVCGGMTANISAKPMLMVFGRSSGTRK